MAIVRGLCTLAEARISIYGDQSAVAATTRDSLIEDYISAATRVIEALPGVGPQLAESRTLVVDGGVAVLLLPYKFNAITSVTVDGVAFTSYTAVGTKGLLYAGTSSAPSTFAAGTQNITIVLTVGTSPVAAEVKMAARELVTHWWRNGQQGSARPAFGGGDTSADPAVAFGVPTRRLMELLGGSSGVGGFA